jgi:AraC-like DNA-binding protein
MGKFVHIKSIAEVYSFNQAKNPSHPLITVIRQWPKSNLDLSEIKFTSDLYFIAMKPNVRGSFDYGRSTYDFQEGTMIFIGPGQAATFSSQTENSENGWAILFHPDLIRQSELGKIIHQFSFFSYESNEALHLSDKEKEFLNNLADNIEQEVHQNMDKHSQELIIQNLQTLLKYCQRYYDRQFYVRSNINKDFVTKFEQFLIEYFESKQLAEKGIPSLNDCGKAMNISGAYLSDLLKAETGKSAKDHIYRFLIEQAKTKLLNSSDSISEIAFAFGFEYPQNFTKLFKQKTGMSPSEYRTLN